ncbi:hypothetical protein SAMN05444422_101377 [Halobiforma haloterrestris]|uniref:Uncharacterized protein n=1 Tax=Natronobacterium haloterrestre TaxID=148448 RepID=A0A1I1D7T6_NATHA|nr:hypothetical protein [Halobiforma haloterrestris]SFB70985.1 hypothetical protein SAMN05444422_101377 [Halobiforma haloterrestris]
MLVHLQQYKHEEVQFDDNRTTGESQTEDSVDKEPEEYFGKNIDDFDLETWETVDHDGDPIQRREVTIDGVTALSVPQEPTEEDDPDLPGRTLQLRLGGGIEFLANVELVEAQDRNPSEPEAEGKVSKEDDPQGKMTMDDEP